MAIFNRLYICSGKWQK